MGAGRNCLEFFSPGTLYTFVRRTLYPLINSSLDMVRQVARVWVQSRCRPYHYFRGKSNMRMYGDSLYLFQHAVTIGHIIIMATSTAYLCEDSCVVAAHLSSAAAPGKQRTELIWNLLYVTSSCNCECETHWGPPFYRNRSVKVTLLFYIWGGLGQVYSLSVHN